jgi:hypothetical protein
MLRPLNPAQIPCSALCFPPTISQSVYTQDSDNENDAVTFSIEATE